MTYESFIKSVDNFIVHSQPTPSFVRAVLENDLMTAVQVADDQSTSNLRSICKFVDECLPRQVFGSRDKVESWLNDNIDSQQRQEIIDTYLERREGN